MPASSRCLTSVIQVISDAGQFSMSISTRSHGDLTSVIQVIRDAGQFSMSISMSISTRSHGDLTSAGEKPRRARWYRCGSEMKRSTYLPPMTGRAHAELTPRSRRDHAERALHLSSCVRCGSRVLGSCGPAVRTHSRGSRRKPICTRHTSQRRSYPRPPTASERAAAWRVGWNYLLADLLTD